MESNFRQPDSRTLQLQKLVNVLFWLINIGLLVMLFLLTWRDLPIPIVWKTVDWSLNRSDVKTLMVDGNGDPWFLVDRLFQDDAYQLRHETAGKVTSWDLPSITFEEAQFVSIAKDKNDNPWLILGKRLAHWDGTQWIFVPMPLDADIKSFICPSVVIKDSLVWGIDNATEQTRIVQLDLNQEPLQTQEILLPDGLDSKQSRFHCIISNNDGLLAVLSNDEQVAFFQLQNSEWQEITSFTKEQPLKVNDVAIDAKGQIWVVLILRSWPTGKPVGSYDPKENTWTWLDIEQPELNIKYIEYGHIAVDNFNRIWLSAKQYGPSTNVFSSSTFKANAIGVYEESPDRSLVRIRQYTTNNSSLETSSLSKIVIGPDGKIWTWNQQVVWLDGNQQELPQPLPDWFVALTNLKVIIWWNVITLALLTVIVVIRIRIRRGR